MINDAIHGGKFRVQLQSLTNVGLGKKCFRNRFQPIIIQECMHPSIIFWTTLKPRSSLCKHNTKLLSNHVQPANQKSAMSAQPELSAPDKSVTTQTSHTITPSILLRFPIGKLPHVAGAQERPAQKVSSQAIIPTSVAVRSQKLDFHVFEASRTQL